MRGVDSFGYAYQIVPLHNGHGTSASAPVTLPRLLVRHSLKLQLPIQRPLQALIFLPFEPLPEQSYDAWQNQAGGDESGADDQDDCDT